MNFWGIFRSENDHLVVGYLMGTEIFEFQPNFGLWRMFKEGNWQGILANFATPFLDIFCAQNDCLIKAQKIFDMGPA